MLRNGTTFHGKHAPHVNNRESIQRGIFANLRVISLLPTLGKVIAQVDAVLKLVLRSPERRWSRESRSAPQV